jgi:hypothetical protein
MSASRTAVRHRAVAALTGLVLAATGLAATGTGTADAATARPTWSTTPAAAERSPMPPPLLTGIRVGRHARFDRVVLDLSGEATGYQVRYVRQLVADGSGHPVELRGRYDLRIRLNPAYAHDDSGSTLTTPASKRWFHPQVKATRLIGDFEAYVTVGVGLRSKKPFRVFTLDDPTRLVVDVRH